MDLEKQYLQSLDEKLHQVAESFYLHHGIKRKRNYDSYTQDNKLSEFELAIVLGLMNKKDYAITPINTNMGLNAGFAVCEIKREGMYIYPEPVLQFTQRQLPEGTDWSEIAECYMSPRNLELLRLAGIEKPKKSRVHYEY